MSQLFRIEYSNGEITAELLSGLLRNYLPPMEAPYIEGALVVEEVVPTEESGPVDFLIFHDWSANSGASSPPTLPFSSAGSGGHLI